MTNTLHELSQLLSTAGYETAVVNAIKSDALVFENDVCLGFAFCYASAPELLSAWARDSRTLIDRYALRLRLAGEKAWNVYLVLLAESPRSIGHQAALNALEEDLVGTRKIARDDITGNSNLREAVFPLLTIVSAPRLEPVDMNAEIKIRATDASMGAVDAFLSTAPEALVLQLLEDGT